MTETVQTPWPASGRAVFLADASTPLEQELLDSWLADTRAADAGEPTVVPLELRDGKKLDARALDAVVDLDDDVVIVPMRVAWLLDSTTLRTAPRVRDLFFGETGNPWAKFVNRPDPDKARCLAGSSATLGELRSRHARLTAGHDVPEELGSFILRQAGIALDVEERKLRGRRYKVPRFVIEGIESSHRYALATEQLAEDEQEPVDEVRERVRGHLREMVATPTTFFVDWMGAITRWITSLGYSQIVTDPENLEQTRAHLRDKPSVLLWTHKSHIDGMALMSVMYEEDFPPSHSMGGANMAFAGVGYAGRRSGTVFIRRRFSDNPGYKLALQQYLGYLLDKRFPLSWAFEGTRSRNGKLGMPRYGLLKYTLDAAHANETRDLHLIPVSINYDLIGETTEYAREEAGQAKEAESLSWFMDYIRRMRAPMGNIYLDFAEPVVLEGAAPEPTRELLAQLNFEVARRANSKVPVTLPALMSFVLLGSAPRALSFPEFSRSMSAILTWLREHDVRLADNVNAEDAETLEKLAENVFSSGVVHRNRDGSQTLYRIGDGQYPVASYYRNTIIHYFIDKAITEVAVAVVADLQPEEREEALFAEAHWLRDLTTYEFYHTPRDRFAETITQHLVEADPDWQTKLAGDRADVLGLLARSTPLVSHATLLPFLQAYWVVVSLVARLDHGQEINESDVVGEALRRASVHLRKGRLANSGSIGKGMFKNAFTLLGDQGLLDSSDEEVRSRLIALDERLERAIHQVRQIGGLVHNSLVQE